MTDLAVDIDRELQEMDRESARRFESAVRHMLALIKGRSSNGKKLLPLAERIANHPAIGSWPKHVNPDAHIAALRDEWE